MKVIVTTTINPPTEAVQKFDALEDWVLVAVGDRKTPSDFKLSRGVYFSPVEQHAYDPSLSEAIGWNCIQRRNFGLLMARDMGADIIAVVDDDNVPYDTWGQDLLLGREVETNYYSTDLPAFDPMCVAGYKELWHRGYPLQLVSQREYCREYSPAASHTKVVADIQADFWDEDPDIDAICRMEHAPLCDFRNRYFPIASNKPSPFNSQNTFISAAVLPHYFMFPHIDRMDDIWASYHVQGLGYKVVYGKASVRHKRHPHNLIKDMKGEYIGYEQNLELVTDLQTNKNAVLDRLPKRSKEAFRLYQKAFRL